MGCVYKLTAPTGKCYIGNTTKTAQERWETHLTAFKSGRRNGALYHAIAKYGADQFKLEIILDNDNWDELCLSERQCIVQYNTKAPHGYNVTDGGEGVVGYVLTSADLDKISKAQKARYTDSAERETLKINGQIGSYISCEKSRGTKKAKDTKTIDPELLKLRRSLATKQGMAKPESREKYLAGMASRDTEAWRANISAGRKGKKYGPSPSRKESIGGIWKDPVKKEIMLTKRRDSIERKQILSAWSAAI